MIHEVRILQEGSYCSLILFTKRRRLTMFLENDKTVQKLNTNDY